MENKEFEGLPDDFARWVGYEVDQASDLEKVPGIVIFKVEDGLANMVGRELFYMDDNKFPLAGHTIDYTGKFNEYIGILFQNGNSNLEQIKMEAINQLEKVLGHIEFEKVGIAKYEGKEDTVEKMLGRATL